MGAPKKYTKKRLREEVQRYFDSISRVVGVTEPWPTGVYDEKGHMTYEQRPVLNRLGEQIMREEYVIPPTVGDLAIFLGIHRSTWAEYCDPEKHPEFSDTTTQARGRMQAYLERELLTRSGKDVKGVEFNLEQNYGAKQKVEVSAGDGFEGWLKNQEESGEGQEF